MISQTCRIMHSSPVAVNLIFKTSTKIKARHATLMTSDQGLHTGLHRLARPNWSRNIISVHRFSGFKGYRNRPSQSFFLRTHKSWATRHQKQPEFYWRVHERREHEIEADSVSSSFGTSTDVVHLHTMGFQHASAPR